MSVIDILAPLGVCGRSAVRKRKERQEVYLYIAPFTVIHSKLSGVDHTVLPANNTTPTFQGGVLCSFKHIFGY